MSPVTNKGLAGEKSEIIFGHFESEFLKNVLSVCQKVTRF